MRNVARQLEEATESVLGQRIYAVEYRAILDQFSALLADFDAQCQDESLHHPLVFLKLEQGRQDLGRALAYLEEFCREAQLSALDQGLAACRRADYLLQEAVAVHQRTQSVLPLPETLHRALVIEPPLPEFELQVTRQAGVSRALFSCPRCGWEFSYVREVDASDFLEVPLSDFSCPMCELAAENASSDGLPLDGSPGSASAR